MNYTIRNYSNNDFDMIRHWWLSANEIAPIKGQLPIDSTFILEMNKQPALCVTVYLTNCKEIAYLENFVGNPELKGVERQKASAYLSDFTAIFAKELGYKRLIALTNKEKLKKRYQELGMVNTLTNLDSFVRKV